jgi:hypothetical protein
MLQIGIDHAQQIGVGVRPSVRDGACQSALPGTHQKTHARFGLRKAPDYFGRGVRALVVDDKNFPRQW